jgi:hypothetical protein
MPWLGIRLDGFGGTFGLAHAAIDAFIGMNDQHVLALVETVDRADFNAIHVFAANAIVGHHIGHFVSCVWTRSRKCGLVRLGSD